MNFFLLSSGFFLGYSLGANDGGNIFGPAVTTRMLRFQYAALVAAIFVVLGAVFAGGGTSHTLSELGSVNMLAGSFTVAIAAAASLGIMVRSRIPVSSSQAVVGAILGWNLFSATHTDVGVLSQIVSAWVIAPLLSAIFAIIIFYLYKWHLKTRKISLFRTDHNLRLAFVVLVAFSAYSLGANNIANVMGMFIDAAPFTPIVIWNNLTISPQKQLFFLGGLSIAAGILFRSMNNARVVGNDIFKMSPKTAFIAIFASSLVLFIFSSKQLASLLMFLKLPPIPLVPVSSSQAIIGAIIGLGIVKGARNIQYKNFFRIAIGWVLNPIIAGIVCFIALYFVQNVFDQTVYTR
jgi:PiT family inorganic phosphate transporter